MPCDCYFGLDLASHLIYGYPTHRLGVTSPQHHVEVPARAGVLLSRVDLVDIYFMKKVVSLNSAVRKIR